MFSRIGSLTVMTLLFLGLVVGCAPISRVPTHAFQGQIKYPKGDLTSLGGHSVEAVHATDNNVRAFGTIGEDGKFLLETLVDGNVRPGVQEGTYRVRLVLSDDDAQARARLAKSIPKKYFDASTSGWTIHVPASSMAELTIE